jgi:hypothetical protein
MSLFSRSNQDLDTSPEDEEKRGGLGFELTPEIQMLIAFGATVIVGLICALTVTPLLRPAASAAVQPTAVPVDFSIPTAREAYPPAVEAIRAVDPGAQMASGAGEWTPNIDMAELDAGRTGWTFYFYLPATNEMATVTVDRGKAVHIVGREAWQSAPQLLSDQSWQIDSPQAVAKLLESCQTTLDSEPDAQVEVRLSAAAENRILLWKMGVKSLNNPLAVCEVTIDAVTGLVR